MKKCFGLLLMVAALSLTAGEGNASVTTEKAPSAEAWKNGRDPVYLLEIDKSPKFEADIVLKNGKKLRFASVKSMMNFFYHPEKYPGYGVGPRGKEIDRMIVRDYLDGTPVDAEKAWYVFGSRVVGPHGDDLIPLSSKTRAELFVKRYGGSRIMDYKEMRSKSFGLIKYLDM
jgi:nitrous oxide reductase accessory protein NosL